MFEDNLVVSQVRHLSSPERWTALASLSFQVALAALVIALPLLHPEKLAFRTETPRILMPPPPTPPIPIQRIQSSSASSGMAEAEPVAAKPLMAPKLPSLLPQQTDDAPSLSALPFGRGMTDGGTNLSAIGDAAHGPRIAVAPAHTPNSTMRISSGVSSGMLLTPIRPLYPEIARVAHVQGTVIVEAIISRAGTIESLHVISGPIMLQQAALNAIRTARYQPYRLNGSPTEVQTTISVNFRLGG